MSVGPAYDVTVSYETDGRVIVNGTHPSLPVVLRPGELCSLHLSYYDSPPAVLRGQEWEAGLGPEPDPAERGEGIIL